MSERKTDPHALEPGKSISIDELSTKAKHFCDDRVAAEEEFLELRMQLAELQRRWYADGRRKLLVVLQAMDAGGKDGTIRKVFRGVNPQGVRVTSFKVPSSLERQHDYLWRIHRAVPGDGMIGIFNRSHYEEVLVVRVEKLVPPHEWKSRYDQINQFEKLLADTGTTILKFFLHISKKEQKQRLQERLDDPEKHWKFSTEDLEKRKQWPDYMAAYEDILNRCTTKWAPWHVVPADQKWYRNLVIARTLVNTLKRLDPQFPPEEPGLDQIEIK